MKGLLNELTSTLLFSLGAAGIAALVYRFLGFGRIVIGVWCCVEVGFFALQRWRYHTLNKVNQKRPSENDVDARFHQFLTLHNVIDIKEFISGWFLNIPFSEIQRLNVADFIAYAYWYRPRTELSAEDDARVLAFTYLLEQTWDVSFPEGCNEKLTLMAHLWHPLKVMHKPLLVHLASEGSMLVTHMCLQGMGFERYQCMGFTYWVKGLPEPLCKDEGKFDAFLLGPSGRMSVLQGFARDIRNLLPHALLPWSEDGRVGRGPVDIMSSLSQSQIQGLREYQARLQRNLQAVAAMRPSLPTLPTLPSFPSLPNDIRAHVAAAREAIPPLPNLPTIPSDLRAQLSAALPCLPQLPQLLQLPSLSPELRAHFVAALVTLPPLPTLPSFPPEVMTSLVAARHAIPDLLPEDVRQRWEATRTAFGEWQNTSSMGNNLTNLRQRTGRRLWRASVALAEASNTIMECAEADGFFVHMRAPTPEATVPTALAASPTFEIARSLEGWLAAATTVLHCAWLDRAALISGITLPSPSDMHALFRTVPEHVATMLPASSLSLRQSVEAEMIKRSNSADVSASGPPSGSTEYNASCFADEAPNLSTRRRTSTPQSARVTPTHNDTSTASTCTPVDTPVDTHATPFATSSIPTPPSTPTASTPDKSPLFFLHGVGFGVFPYLGFVSKLTKAFQGRPFILLEVRHVSLRLCMQALGVEDVVRSLAEVMRRHDVVSANFVGHSFGTFVIAHMRKLFPEHVESVLLCDPVCMLTCFPQLLYNFIYKGVTFDGMMKNPADAARWLAARDLIIADTFCRHFWWHTLMLWPNELPNPSVLVLSGKDDLVPSELVCKQLETAPSHVRVLTQPDLYHGHFLFQPAWQDTIVATYKEALELKAAEDLSRAVHVD